jgi:phosphatidylglycerophosphate synthase
MKLKHAGATAGGQLAAADAPQAFGDQWQAGPVAGLIAQMLLLAALARSVGLHGGSWVTGITCGVIIDLGLGYGLSRYRAVRLAPADWVTLARATLAVGVAALVANSFGHRTPAPMLVSLTAVALALDAVDGWVARRSRTTPIVGAHFDAEVDAFLILVLSVYVARSAGAWVLTIGAARYAFLLAGWRTPWMRGALPARYWRKVVAATQGIMLTVAAAKVLPLGVSQAALGVALALLAESFGRDILWLRSPRNLARARATHGSPSGPGSEGDPLPDPPDGSARGGVRTAISVALTILAVIVVWAALVAPDQPSEMTLNAFARVPLEGLGLILVALVMPRKVRRIFAVSAGLLFTLVVVLKIANYEIFTYYDRSLDPVGDLSQISNGIETLRFIDGKTKTTMIEIGVVVAIVVASAGLCFAMLRLTRVAVVNRRRSLGAVGVLGVLSALCWASGAQLIPRTPIASTLSASFFVHEVHAVQADIHDRAVFAKQINHDSFKPPPSEQLLTALRGKDVLLVFVEAYGQVAVQGKWFSPRVDKALAQGNDRLAGAGFSSRSGFLTSATYGGISWLAHSSLQSGLWVNSEIRYNELLTAQRFTLAGSFKRAGWRTVADDPSNDRPWPQGQAYYHYDKVYNRDQVGYHGPTFTYASMPDQYMFLELQRLELGKQHRKPLFAEVDTISSHMPWNRIPEEIGWNQVGNGSVFNRLPEDKNLDGPFWVTPKRVQAAYTTSIVYSMNTLTSFVQHYGKKNLVMIVVGDHQPLPNVSGENSNHDVPISIIAHDPKVLKQIGSWGWGPGLQPKANAPVWPMSAFRNRFLSAFDSHRGSE